MTAEHERELHMADGSAAQVAFYLDLENRHPAFVAGFGAGKTYVGLRKLLMLAGYNAHHTKMHPFTYMAVEPTFPMVQRILYPTLFDQILNPLDIDYTHYKSAGNPYVYIPGLNATFAFYSGHNPAKIVGSECAGAYVDEAHLMSHQSWINILRRVRDGKAPLLQAFATFTPELPSWTHDMWGRFELEGEPLPEGYAVYHASTRSNKYLPADYADLIASEVEEGMVTAVVDGHFTTTKMGKVYSTYDSHLNKSDVAKYDASLPLALAFDFNPGDVGVTLEVCQANGPHFYVVDEINIKGYSLEQTCGEILDRYGVHQKAPVTIYGDATGHRSTSLRTEYKVIKDILSNGYSGGQTYLVPFTPPVNMDVPRANPSVADRCSAVRTLLRDSMGNRRLFINPACKRLLKDFQRVIYESYRQEQAGKVYKGNAYDISKSDGTVTHASDALGYYIFRVRPSRNAFKRQVDYRIG